MAEEWERVIDLARYYPEFLNGNRELRAITGTEGAEIRRLYEKSDQLWADGYIRESTHQGIKRWESLLGMKPWPGDTLEERRSSVLGKWNQQLPYTLQRLHERLQAVVGTEGYELYLRHLIYELELDIIDQPYRVLQSLHDMTKQMVPANLFLRFAGKYLVDIPVETSVMADLAMKSEFFARYNREYLRLDNTWQLNNTYRLNNYKEKEAMEFYPGVITAAGGYRVPVCTAAGLELVREISVEPEAESCLRINGEATGNMMSGGELAMEADLIPGIEADFTMTMEHDKWLLDNQVKLDNTKKLDAYAIQYDL